MLSSKRNSNLMDPIDLDPIFRPRSLAVVGASNDPYKWGYLLLDNVLQGEFAGPVYPVNPQEPQVHEMTAYPRLTDVPGSSDVFAPLRALGVNRGLPSLRRRSSCDGGTTPDRRSGRAGPKPPGSRRGRRGVRTRCAAGLEPRLWSAVVRRGRRGRALALGRPWPSAPSSDFRPGASAWPRRRVGRDLSNSLLIALTAKPRRSTVRYRRFS